MTHDIGVVIEAGADTVRPTRSHGRLTRFRTWVETS